MSADDVLILYSVVTWIVFLSATASTLGNLAEWKDQDFPSPNPEKHKKQCKVSLRFAILAPLWPLVLPWALYKLVRFAFNDSDTF